MLPQLDLSNLTPSTSLDRKILSESDVEQFKRSLPFEWVQEYLKEMIDSTDPLAEIAPERPSPVVEELCKFLTKVSLLVESTPTVPPSDQAQTFTSFRSKLAVLATGLHLQLLPSFRHADVLLPELQFHVLRSFGSTSRLDYGTGHELSFLLYLLSLRLSGILTEKDSREVVQRVLGGYWEVRDEGRKKFGLKVAGRRGVWREDEEGRVWFDQGASEKRGHPSRSKSSSSISSLSSLHLNTSSTPLNLLRSLLSNTHPSSSPSGSGSSTPNPYSLARTPSPSNSPKHESRSDLLQLYIHTTLTSLPCLLHLRFGSLLPFASVSTESGQIVALTSSADSLPLPISGEGSGAGKGGVMLSDQELENLQNKREGSEGTMAPWNPPTLAGFELESKEKEGETGGRREKGSPTSSLKRGKSRLSVSESAEEEE
ncbi:uncharacterized protein JCM6883_001213 [Sporobolomyces salmoneus]|uniref:uncharacterized protein n=1 Tax=Sporobolomyces salmoneus TaxID=183962 RepID=UPI0031803F78